MNTTHDKTIISEVNEYQEKKKGNVVILATSRGSMNYGLHSKSFSDYDSIALVLPSWNNIMMGRVVDNAHLIDKENGTDIYAMDIRNMDKVFTKPNFANLQLVWALHRYSFLGSEIEKWIEEKSLSVIQKNLKPLLLSSLGRYRAESKRGMTDKEMSLHLYNLRLIELLISKKDLTHAELKQFALTLGTKPYPKTFASLFDLKFQGSEREFFKKELETSVSLLELQLPELTRLKNGCEELDELNNIIANTVFNFMRPNFFQ